MPGPKQCFAPDCQLESQADKKIELQHVMSLTEWTDGELTVAGSFAPES